MHFAKVRSVNSVYSRFTSLLRSTYRNMHCQKMFMFKRICVQQQAVKSLAGFNEFKLCHFQSPLMITNYSHHSTLRKKQMLRNAKSQVLPMHIHSNPKTEKSKLEEFDSVLNVMCKDLMSEQNADIFDALKWHINVLNYNVKNGKKVRGLAVGKAYKILAEDSFLQQDMHLAHILGWCVEMLQAFFLIADDIMDNSDMRRGEPCWYKKPDVGLCAINDSLILQSGIYKILKNYFENKKCYQHILEEFLEATRKTVYGQCLDMLSCPSNQRPRFETFTPARHNAIVEYKTSYYTFCLPVHLAMHLIGTFQPEDFQITTRLCLKLGLLFQIQDDYLDCFGDPKLTGKIGTDISEGKCTWFVVQALNETKGDIRKEILDNYGLKCEESTLKVFNIYQQLSLKEKFHEFEEKMYNEVKLLNRELLHCSQMLILFDDLLNSMYKRKK